MFPSDIGWGILQTNYKLVKYYMKANEETGEGIGKEAARKAGSGEVDCLLAFKEVSSFS